MKPKTSATIIAAMVSRFPELVSQEDLDAKDCGFIMKHIQRRFPCCAAGTLAALKRAVLFSDYPASPSTPTPDKHR